MSTKKDQEKSVYSRNMDLHERSRILLEGGSIKTDWDLIVELASAQFPRANKAVAKPKDEAGSAVG